MNWEEAIDLIRNSITIGTILDEDSEYRIVEAGPDHKCYTYDYNGSLGYHVRIGSITHVEIPFSMLEILFSEAKHNGEVYNNSVFKKRFARQLRNHGCHVHVVGKIFELSGVANKNGNDFHLQ